jgi:hypothetical protein
MLAVTNVSLTLVSEAPMAEPKADAPIINKLKSAITKTPLLDNILSRRIASF